MVDHWMPLTRAEVARRIGRSIATVRRLEETGILSPKLLVRSVRHFDADDVDEVLKRIKRTGRALSHTTFESSRVTTLDITEELRRRLHHQAERVAELEKRACYLGAKHGRLRTALLDAVSELADVIPPRSQAALCGLERIVALLVDER
jgi:DNA-binding transcriptional MerR regulator